MDKINGIERLFAALTALGALVLVAGLVALAMLD
jgi:hypothetical protein